MEQWDVAPAQTRGTHRDWPTKVTDIDCPNCDAVIPVDQTSYGARATCIPCRIRWTTLFSEKGAWTDERYNPSFEA